MFTITFSQDEPTDRFNEPTAQATITIGDFSEQLSIPTSFWSREQYRVQWRTELTCLVRGESDVACLLVSMREPSTVNFLFAWVIYCIDGKYHAQNVTIFAPKNGFDLDSLHEYIPAYGTVSDDGEAVSDWPVTDQDLAEFLA